MAGSKSNRVRKDVPAYYAASVSRFSSLVRKPKYDASSEEVLSLDICASSRATPPQPRHTFVRHYDPGFERRDSQISTEHECGTDVSESPLRRPAEKKDGDNAVAFTLEKVCTRGRENEASGLLPPLVLPVPPYLEQRYDGGQRDSIRRGSRRKNSHKISTSLSERRRRTSRQTLRQPSALPAPSRDRSSSPSREYFQERRDASVEDAQERGLSSRQSAGQPLGGPQQEQQQQKTVPHQQQAPPCQERCPQKNSTDQNNNVVEVSDQPADWEGSEKKTLLFTIDALCFANEETPSRSLETSVSPPPAAGVPAHVLFEPSSATGANSAADRGTKRVKPPRSITVASSDSKGDAGIRAPLDKKLERKKCVTTPPPSAGSEVKSTARVASGAWPADAAAQQRKSAAQKTFTPALSTDELDAAHVEVVESRLALPSTPSKATTDFSSLISTLSRSSFVSLSSSGHQNVSRISRLLRRPLQPLPTVTSSCTLESAPHMQQRHLPAAASTGRSTAGVSLVPMGPASACTSQISVAAPWGSECPSVAAPQASKYSQCSPPVQQLLSVEQLPLFRKLVAEAENAHRERRQQKLQSLRQQQQQHALLRQLLKHKAQQRSSCSTVHENDGEREVGSDTSTDLRRAQISSLRRKSGNDRKRRHCDAVILPGAAEGAGRLAREARNYGAARAPNVSTTLRHVIRVCAASRAAAVAEQRQLRRRNGRICTLRSSRNVLLGGGRNHTASSNSGISSGSTSTSSTLDNVDGPSSGRSEHQKELGYQSKRWFFMRQKYREREITREESWATRSPDTVVKPTKNSTGLPTTCCFGSSGGSAASPAFHTDEAWRFNDHRPNVRLTYNEHVPQHLCRKEIGDMPLYFHSCSPMSGGGRGRHLVPSGSSRTRFYFSQPTRNCTSKAQLVSAPNASARVSNNTAAASSFLPFACRLLTKDLSGKPCATKEKDEALGLTGTSSTAAAAAAAVAVCIPPTVGRGLHPRSASLAASLSTQGRAPSSLSSFFSVPVNEICAQERRDLIACARRQGYVLLSSNSDSHTAHSRHSKSNNGSCSADLHHLAGGHPDDGNADAHYMEGIHTNNRPADARRLGSDSDSRTANSCRTKGNQESRLADSEGRKRRPLDGCLLVETKKKGSQQLLSCNPRSSSVFLEVQRLCSPKKRYWELYNKAYEQRSATCRGSSNSLRRLQELLQQQQQYGGQQMQRERHRGAEKKKRPDNHRTIPSDEDAVLVDLHAFRERNPWCCDKESVDDSTNAAAAAAGADFSEFPITFPLLPEQRWECRHTELIKRNNTATQKDTCAAQGSLTRDTTLSCSPAETGRSTSAFYPGVSTGARRSPCLLFQRPSSPAATTDCVVAVTAADAVAQTSTFEKGRDVVEASDQQRWARRTDSRSLARSVCEPLLRNGDIEASAGWQQLEAALKKKQESRALAGHERLLQYFHQQLWRHFQGKPRENMARERGDSKVAWCREFFPESYGGVNATRKHQAMQGTLPLSMTRFGDGVDVAAADEEVKSRPGKPWNVSSHNMLVPPAVNSHSGSEYHSNSPVIVDSQRQAVTRYREGSEGAAGGGARLADVGAAISSARKELKPVPFTDKEIVTPLSAALDAASTNVKPVPLSSQEVVTPLCGDEVGPSFCGRAAARRGRKTLSPSRECVEYAFSKSNKSFPLSPLRRRFLGSPPKLSFSQTTNTPSIVHRARSAILVAEGRDIGPTNATAASRSLSGASGASSWMNSAATVSSSLASDMQPNTLGAGACLVRAGGQTATTATAASPDLGPADEVGRNELGTSVSLQTQSKREQHVHPSSSDKLSADDVRLPSPRGDKDTPGSISRSDEKTGADDVFERRFMLGTAASGQPENKSSSISPRASDARRAAVSARGEDARTARDECKSEFLFPHLKEAKSEDSLKDLTHCERNTGLFGGASARSKSNKRSASSRKSEFGKPDCKSSVKYEEERLKTDRSSDSDEKTMSLHSSTTPSGYVLLVSCEERSEGPEKLAPLMPAVASFNDRRSSGPETDSAHQNTASCVSSRQIVRPHTEAVAGDEELPEQFFLSTSMRELDHNQNRPVPPAAAGAPASANDQNPLLAATAFTNIRDHILPRPETAVTNTQDHTVAAAAATTAGAMECVFGHIQGVRIPSAETSSSSTFRRREECHSSTQKRDKRNCCRLSGQAVEIRSTTEGSRGDLGRTAAALQVPNSNERRQAAVSSSILHTEDGVSTLQKAPCDALPSFHAAVTQKQTQSEASTTVAETFALVIDEAAAAKAAAKEAAAEARVSACTEKAGAVISACLQSTITRSVAEAAARSSASADCASARETAGGAGSTELLVPAEAAPTRVAAGDISARRAVRSELETAVSSSARLGCCSESAPGAVERQRLAVTVVLTPFSASSAVAGTAEDGRLAASLKQNLSGTCDYIDGVSEEKSVSTNTSEKGSCHNGCGKHRSTPGSKQSSEARQNTRTENAFQKPPGTCRNNSVRGVNPDAVAAAGGTTAIGEPMCGCYHAAFSRLSASTSPVCKNASRTESVTLVGSGMYAGVNGGTDFNALALRGSSGVAGAAACSIDDVAYDADLSRSVAGNASNADQLLSLLKGRPIFSEKNQSACSSATTGGVSSHAMRDSSIPHVYTSSAALSTCKDMQEVICDDGFAASFAAALVANQHTTSSKRVPSLSSLSQHKEPQQQQQQQSSLQQPWSKRRSSALNPHSHQQTQAQYHDIFHQQSQWQQQGRQQQQHTQHLGHSEAQHGGLPQPQGKPHQQQQQHAASRHTQQQAMQQIDPLLLLQQRPSVEQDSSLSQLLLPQQQRYGHHPSEPPNGKERLQFPGHPPPSPQQQTQQKDSPQDPQKEDALLYKPVVLRAAFSDSTLTATQLCASEFICVNCSSTSETSRDAITTRVAAVSPSTESPSTANLSSAAIRSCSKIELSGAPGSGTDVACCRGVLCRDGVSPLCAGGTGGLDAAGVSHTASATGTDAAGRTRATQSTEAWSCSSQLRSTVSQWTEKESSLAGEKRQQPHWSAKRAEGATLQDRNDISRSLPILASSREGGELVMTVAAKTAAAATLTKATADVRSTFLPSQLLSPSMSTIKREKAQGTSCPHVRHEESCGVHACGRGDGDSTTDPPGNLNTSSGLGLISASLASFASSLSVPGRTEEAHLEELLNQALQQYLQKRSGGRLGPSHLSAEVLQQESRALLQPPAEKGTAGEDVVARLLAAVTAASADAAESADVFQVTSTSPSTCSVSTFNEPRHGRDGAAVVPASAASVDVLTIPVGPGGSFTDTVSKGFSRSGPPPVSTGESSSSGMVGSNVGMHSSTYDNTAFAARAERALEDIRTHDALIVANSSSSSESACGLALRSCSTGLDTVHMRPSSPPPRPSYIVTSGASAVARKPSVLTMDATSVAAVNSSMGANAATEQAAQAEPPVISAAAAIAATTPTATASTNAIPTLNVGEATTPVAPTNSAAGELTNVVKEIGKQNKLVTRTMIRKYPPTIERPTMPTGEAKPAHGGCSVFSSSQEPGRLFTKTLPNAPTEEVAGELVTQQGPPVQPSCTSSCNNSSTGTLEGQQLLATHALHYINTCNRQRAAMTKGPESLKTEPFRKSDTTDANTAAASGASRPTETCATAAAATAAAARCFDNQVMQPNATCSAFTIAGAADPQIGQQLGCSALRVSADPSSVKERRKETESIGGRFSPSDTPVASTLHLSCGPSDADAGNKRKEAGRNTAVCSGSQGMTLSRIGAPIAEQDLLNGVAGVKNNDSSNQTVLHPLLLASLLGMLSLESSVLRPLLPVSPLKKNDQSCYSDATDSESKQSCTETFMGASSHMQNTRHKGSRRSSSSSCCKEISTNSPLSSRTCRSTRDPVPLLVSTASVGVPSTVANEWIASLPPELQHAAAVSMSLLRQRSQASTEPSYSASPCTSLLQLCRQLQPQQRHLESHQVLSPIQFYDQWATMTMGRFPVHIQNQPSPYQQQEQQQKRQEQEHQQHMQKGGDEDNYNSYKWFDEHRHQQNAVAKVVFDGSTSIPHKQHATRTAAASAAAAPSVMPANAAEWGAGVMGDSAAYEVVQHEATEGAASDVSKGDAVRETVDDEPLQYGSEEGGAGRSLSMSQLRQSSLAGSVSPEKWEEPRQQGQQQQQRARQQPLYVGQQKLQPERQKKEEEKAVALSLETQHASEHINDSQNNAAEFHSSHCATSAYADMSQLSEEQRRSLLVAYMLNMLQEAQQRQGDRLPQIDEKHTGLAGTALERQLRALINDKDRHCLQTPPLLQQEQQQDGGLKLQHGAYQELFRYLQQMSKQQEEQKTFQVGVEQQQMLLQGTSSQGGLLQATEKTEVTVVENTALPSITDVSAHAHMGLPKEAEQRAAEKAETGTRSSGTEDVERSITCGRHHNSTGRRRTSLPAVQNEMERWTSSGTGRNGKAERSTKRNAASSRRKRSESTMRQKECSTIEKTPVEAPCQEVNIVSLLSQKRRGDRVSRRASNQSKRSNDISDSRSSSSNHGSRLTSADSRDGIAEEAGGAASSGEAGEQQTDHISERQRRGPRKRDASAGLPEQHRTVSSVGCPTVVGALRDARDSSLLKAFSAGIECQMKNKRTSRKERKDEKKERKKSKTSYRPGKHAGANENLEAVHLADLLVAAGAAAESSTTSGLTAVEAAGSPAQRQPRRVPSLYSTERESLREEVQRQQQHQTQTGTQQQRQPQVVYERQKTHPNRQGTHSLGAQHGKKHAAKEEKITSRKKNPRSSRHRISHESFIGKTSSINSRGNDAVRPAQLEREKEVPSHRDSTSRRKGHNSTEDRLRSSRILDSSIQRRELNTQASRSSSNCRKRKSGKRSSSPAHTVISSRRDVHNDRHHRRRSIQRHTSSESSSAQRSRGKLRSSGTFLRVRSEKNYVATSGVSPPEEDAEWQALPMLRKHLQQQWELQEELQQVEQQLAGLHLLNSMTVFAGSVSSSAARLNRSMKESITSWRGHCIESCTAHDGISNEDCSKDNRTSHTSSACEENGASSSCGSSGSTSYYYTPMSFSTVSAMAKQRREEASGVTLVEQTCNPSSGGTRRFIVADETAADVCFFQGGFRCASPTKVFPVTVDSIGRSGSRSACSSRSDSCERILGKDLLNLSGGKVGLAAVKAQLLETGIAATDTLNRTKTTSTAATCMLLGSGLQRTHPNVHSGDSNSAISGSPFRLAAGAEYACSYMPALSLQGLRPREVIRGSGSPAYGRKEKMSERCASADALDAHTGGAVAKWQVTTVGNHLSELEPRNQEQLRIRFRSCGALQRRRREDSTFLCHGEDDNLLLSKNENIGRKKTHQRDISLTHKGNENRLKADRPHINNKCADTWLGYPKDKHHHANSSAALLWLEEPKKSCQYTNSRGAHVWLDHLASGDNLAEAGNLQSTRQQQRGQHQRLKKPSKRSRKSLHSTMVLDTETDEATETDEDEDNSFP